jgi:hypothetical protein
MCQPWLTLYRAIEKGHRHRETVTLQLEVSEARRRGIPKTRRRWRLPRTEPKNTPQSRALFLTALFSQAGQGQVLFLGPGQLALANDDLNRH